MSTIHTVSTSDIPPFVLNLFSEAKDQPITGSQLSQLIKFKFPDFNPMRYGCRNLRDFLRQYVPDVAEVSRSGMDFVYALRGHGPETPVDGASPAPPSAKPAIQEPFTSSESAIWKTFASPQTKFRLFADPDTGTLIVVRPGSQAPGESWKEVPSCPREKHIEIAKSFMGQLGEEITTQLNIQFDQPSWWLIFYNELKRLNLAGQWNAFRREKILGQLRAELEKLGISVSGVPSAAAVLNAVRPSASIRTAKNSRIMGADSGIGRLRRLAAAIVTNMSAGELRQLRVSLGDVVDVLDL